MFDTIDQNLIIKELESLDVDNLLVFLVLSDLIKNNLLKFLNPSPSDIPSSVLWDAIKVVFVLSC